MRLEDFLYKTGLEAETLEDLLSGVNEPSPDPISEFDKMLETLGIYPGTTRTPARTLYAEYAANTPKPLALRVWGKHMAQRFKRTRHEAGISYWISRKKDPVIPDSIKTSPKNLPEK